MVSWCAGGPGSDLDFKLVGRLQLDIRVRRFDLYKVRLVRTRLAALPLLHLSRRDLLGRYRLVPLVVLLLGRRARFRLWLLVVVGGPGPGPPRIARRGVRPPPRMRRA